MLSSVLATTALWKFGPAWLHPVILLVAALLAVWVFVALVRYITSERRVLAELPSRAEHRWPDGWQVTRYHRVLLTFLKVHDWRPLSATAAGPDRLLLCVQRDRHRVTLLLLRPGPLPTDDDIAFIRAMQERDGTWEAVLISDPVGAAPPTLDGIGHSLVMLGYDALLMLSDALDGGPEEDRRNRAAAQAAAAV